MTTNGNGGTDSERIDARTADLTDPSTLRELFVQIDETGKAAIEGGQEFARRQGAHILETRDQHAAVMAAIHAIGNAFGPKLAALDTYVRKEAEDNAAAHRTTREEIAVHRRAFDAALAIEAMAREEADKGQHVEAVKMNARIAENRAAINELSGPDVPDMADVTKVQDVPAMVRAQINEHTLEVTRTALADAKQAEKDRKAAEEADRKERRARRFAVAMLVLGALTGVGGKWLLDWLK